MILSSQLIFSENQEILQDQDSTNVVDLGVRGTPYSAAAPLHGDIGKGNKIPILIQITETFNNNSTLAVEIQTGSDESLGTTIIRQEIDPSDAVVGQQFYIEVLPNQITERYLGIKYSNLLGQNTTGRVTAAITMGNQTNITGA